MTRITFGLITVLLTTSLCGCNTESDVNLGRQHETRKVVTPDADGDATIAPDVSARQGQSGVTAQPGTEKTTVPELDIDALNTETGTPETTVPKIDIHARESENQ